MTLPELVDSLVSDRLLVLGSLPPEGRDLDLLVPAAAERDLCAALAAAGFSVHEGEWVRFGRCSVDAIDVVGEGTLDLPEAERRALFAEALPLERLAHLARPAPHHLLLLLARRYRGAARPPLGEGKRRRIDRALAEDPRAWERARERSPAWHGERALDALEAAYRVAPGHTVGDGATGARAELAFFRQAPMIAFSGLDGSGKTSQAEALEETLRRLGFDVAVEWTRLEWTTLWEHSAVLDRISGPVKRVLRLLTRSPVDAARTAPYGERPADAAAELRQRSAAITHVWVLVVVLVHAAAQRRAVLRPLREGKVVICDRYTLDAAVHLRERYGAERRFRYQIRLLHRLCPRPIRAYLVDVPGPLAFARKPEHFDLDELTRQAALYRELAVRLGVRPVNGARTREDLCAEIAYDVWSALRGVE